MKATTGIVIRGAGQCPNCGCRKVARFEQDVTTFYGGTMEVCKNCGAVWEPIPIDQLRDPAREPLGAFKEPCDNCAFRPGSPEQKDRLKWRHIMSKLKDAGGGFYCHKGVPLDLRHAKGDSGFAYPKGGKDPRKLRLCRGYLRMLPSWLARFSEKHKGDGDVGGGPR